jgi:hypothetical protein
VAAAIPIAGMKRLADLDKGVRIGGPPFIFLQIILILIILLATATHWRKRSLADFHPFFHVAKGPTSTGPEIVGCRSVIQDIRGGGGRRRFAPA